jgi:hypothetical protein
MTEEAGAAALAALDRALDDRPDKIYGDLANAVRCLVRLRDELIAERRRSGGAAGDGRLERVNAILSVVSGGEYPLEGVRRERIEQAREELTRLLSQAHRSD